MKSARTIIEAKMTQCRELAAAAKSEADRSRWIKMAAFWRTRLADSENVDPTAVTDWTEWARQRALAKTTPR